MTNLETYNNIFCETFQVREDELDEEFTFKDVDKWDSIVHLTLITELEDAFDIMFESEDITSYGSYENGKKILENYGVSFEE